MKVIIKLIVCMLCIYQTLSAQTDFYIPHTTSWGNVSMSMNPQNAWGLYTNPASLVYSTNISTGIACQQLYGLHDIVYSTFCFGTSNTYGAMGTTFTLLNNDYFDSYSLSVHYAKQLLHNLSLAISCTYTQTNTIVELYNSHTIIPQISGTYTPFNELLVGFKIVQPIQILLKQSPYYQEFNYGASYTGIPKTTVSVHVHTSHEDFNKTSLGIDYQINKSFTLSGLIANRYNPFALGFGYTLSRITCQYISELHSYLGFSHTVSFLFRL